jgi:hypothetical protein
MSNVFDSMTSKNGNGKPADAAEPSEVESPDSVEDLKAFNSSATPLEIRELTQELLRHGHLEESRKADSFRKAIVHQKAIQSALEPLDLDLQIDSHRGVAFLTVVELKNDEASEDQAWSHPLVRRQRLTLEQSLLVAILRQAFVAHEQETGVGESPARVAVEDLLPQFLTYFEDSGSDAKNESRLSNLLDQLKTHGIVSEVDKKQEVTIRPLIAHIANPESLTSLLETLRQQAGSETKSNVADEKGLEGDAHE